MQIILSFSPAGPIRSWRRRCAIICSFTWAAGRTELFPDGELIVRVDEDVRGRDCFIIQPTCHPVNATLDGVVHLDRHA